MWGNTRDDNIVKNDYYVYPSNQDGQLNPVTKRYSNSCPLGYFLDDFGKDLDGNSISVGKEDKSGSSFPTSGTFHSSWTVAGLGMECIRCPNGTVQEVQGGNCLDEEPCIKTQVQNSIKYEATGSIAGVTGNVFQIDCKNGFFGNGTTVCKSSGSFTTISCIAAPICIKGEYLNQESESCKKMSASTCPQGEEFSSSSATNQITFIGSQIDDGECNQCQIGKAKPDIGLQACDPCQTAENTGTRECDICSKGTFVDSSNFQCESCITGKYSNSFNAVACIDCPSSFSAIGIGNTECSLTCIAGTYIDTDATDGCSACGAGQYTTQENSLECLLCDVGFAQANAGSKFCLPCFPSTFQNQRGSSLCISCDSNTYSSGPSSISCEQCEIGQTSSVGSMRCNEEDALRTAKNALEIERDSLKEEKGIVITEKIVLATERDALQIAKDTLTTENEAMVTERNTLQNDKIVLENEKTALELVKTTIESEKSVLTERTNTLELEKTSLESEKTILIQEKLVLLKKTNTLETQQGSLQMNMTQIEKQIIDLRAEIVVVKQTDVNTRSKPSSSTTSTTSTDVKSKSNSTCECEHSDNDKKSASTFSNEAPNLSLYLMAATVGMIMTLCVIYFLFCCCRKKATTKTLNPNTTVVPVKKGKLRLFVDQNHDKITKVAHHDHAKSVQKMSRAHSKAKVKIIQKKQDNAKSRLQTRLQMRANMNNNATRDEKNKKKVKVTQVEIVELDKKETKKHQAKKLAKEERKAKKRALKAQLLLERRHAKEKDTVITKTKEMKLTRTTSVI